MSVRSAATDGSNFGEGFDTLVGAAFLELREGAERETTWRLREGLGTKKEGNETERALGWAV